MAHGIENNGADQADIVIRKVNHCHIKLHIRMHGHHNVNLYCFLVRLPPSVNTGPIRLAFYRAVNCELKADQA